VEVYKVPHKLQASTFEQLKRLMLLNNAKLGGRVIYDICPPSYKGAKWYAFYTQEVDEKQVLSDEIKNLGK
jgi:hypothetical protein